MGFNPFDNFNLFGGGDDSSHAEGVNYPDYFNDPNFTDTQSFLNQYSKDLLTKGPNDYYAPIGQYNTPEFQAAMQQASQATVGATDAALARSGRARGGQGAAIAAQSLGDANAKAVYADYLRAMEGRKGFFDAGLNTQAFVNKQGFANQGSRNAFNVGGAEFDYRKALGLDAYDRQNSEDIGKMIGNIAPIAGAGLGFLVGGPAGASVGYGIGSSFGGGEGTTPQWLDTITKAKSAGGVTADASTAGGVSSIGRITGNSSTPDLMKLLALYK